jgi:hypothetical protein
LAEQKYLCVITPEYESSEWFLLRPQWRPTKLERMPQSMMQLSEFKVSPNHKWVAIVSAGEGHPMLDVVNLEKVLAERESDSEVKPDEASYTINPYPGFINLVGWQGEKLIFTTDRWLAYNTPLLNEDEMQFALNLLTGEIKPLSTDLTDPLVYYGKILKSKPEQWKSLEAITALQQINKLTAIPLLKEILRQQKDPELRQAIQEAIKAIKTNQSQKKDKS